MPVGRHPLGKGDLPLPVSRAGGGRGKQVHLGLPLLVENRKQVIILERPFMYRQQVASSENIHCPICHPSNVYSFQGDVLLAIACDAEQSVAVHQPKWGPRIRDLV